MAQLTKEITRLKTAVFYEDIITKMEYKDGDGEVRSYLERQRYLLLEDFCRPLRSALATKLRGNGQDSMLRSLGPALVRSRCFERSGHGYRLHLENTGSGALKKIRVRKLTQCYGAGAATFRAAPEPIFFWSEPGAGAGSRSRLI